MVSVDSLDPELFDDAFSPLFFFVIVRARTGPSVAVLRTELCGLNPGTWKRMGLLGALCFGSIWGTGGASMPGLSAGLFELLDLTLTTAAFPRTIVCAGRGETIALLR